MDFVATIDTKKNVRCRIVGAPREANYFDQPMFFAYDKNVLYLRIGDDVYESQEALDTGHDVAVHCRTHSTAPLLAQDDTNNADRLSDVCLSETVYLFWAAGTTLEDEDIGPATIDSVSARGSEAGVFDQQTQCKKQKAELVDSFLRELDNGGA